MTWVPPLVASHFTMTGTPVGQPPRFTFAERVAAAADAGFAGVGLLVDDYSALLREGQTDASLRAVLDAHGLRILEVEFLFDWYADGERAAQAAAAEALMHRIADAFSPHHLSVGVLDAPGDAPPLAVMAERFAAVCDRAAEHGTRVALEFLPWTAIPDLAGAADLVEAADRPNGGVLVDSWHYFRSRPDEARLRSLGRSKIVGVQLDDADDPVGPSWEDTMLRRRYPGDGSFDLVGLLRIFADVGVVAPYSVEVMSPEHQALPVDTAARRAHDTTAAVLREAIG